MTKTKLMLLPIVFFIFALLVFLEKFRELKWGEML